MYIHPDFFISGGAANMCNDKNIQHTWIKIFYESRIYSILERFLYNDLSQWCVYENTDKG